MRAKASQIIDMIFNLVRQEKISVDDEIEMSGENGYILVKYGKGLTNTNYVKSENDIVDVEREEKPHKIMVSGKFIIENMDLSEFNIISNSVKVNKNITNDDLKEIFKG